MIKLLYKYDCECEGGGGRKGVREEKRKKREEGFIMLIVLIDYRGYEILYLLLEGW